MPVIFGDIPELKEGDTFASRQELSEKDIHRPTQAGIAGRVKSEPKGSESIVLSDGYEDDRDEGDIIYYTGAGGRDDKTFNQVSNQSFEGEGRAELSNKALAISKDLQLPVRVIKNIGSKSKPLYEYRGLYLVNKCRLEIGKSGFKICRFILVKQKLVPIEVQVKGHEKPDRKPILVQRLIRDSKVSLEIKRMYDYKCQICNQTIQLPNTNYIEGAHIKPLGKPHNGPDTNDNIIALCPNHHVQFDNNAISIEDNFDLIGYDGRLTVNNKHKINIEYIRYHRSFIQNG